MVTGMVVLTAYAVEVEMYIVNLVAIGRIRFVLFVFGVYGEVGVCTGFREGPRSK